MAVRFVLMEIDKPRRLRFDPNAIADLEGALNMGLSSIFQEQMMGVRVLRAMLWAGLRWEDRGLTLERAGDLFRIWIEHGGTIESLAGKLTEALAAGGWMKIRQPGEELADEGNGTGA